MDTKLEQELFDYDPQDDSGLDTIQQAVAYGRVVVDVDFAAFERQVAAALAAKGYTTDDFDSGRVPADVLEQCGFGKPRVKDGISIAGTVSGRFNSNQPTTTARPRKSS